jgi:toxin YoeB
MNYSIEFSLDAQKVIKKWKKSNPLAFKKLYNLLPELEQHPRTGTGHPEPLKGGDGITYSRRLSAHDRIVYDIYDDVVTVLVLDVEGYYNDK